MKSIIQQIAEQTRAQENKDVIAVKSELADPSTSNDRSNFLKKAALGEIALGGLMHLSIAYTDQLKTISDTLETPVNTGGDIYLLQGFKSLIDIHAVDIVHPDLAAAGGLLETKKIEDYAEEHGVAMAMHWGGTPVSFMANVHCAAATQNVLALEHHLIDTLWWESMMKMTGSQPIITKGYANVPLDSPGLGVELNDDVVKEHLEPDSGGYFEPTTEWNKKGFHDRIWS